MNTLNQNVVTFIKNAEHVDIQRIGRNKGDIMLTVNDSTVNLNRRHPISIASSLTTPEDAMASLANGHFMFVTDQHGETSLKEYRDHSYNGFIQTDDFIQRFGTDATLGNRSTSEFNLPEFGLGGDFNLTAGFTWSAFSKNLQTSVSVLRQICSNGMVARMPLFERQVPVINLFDQHLDIASRQLIDVSRRHITSRIEKMGREHAMVKEVSLVQAHIGKRIKADPSNSRLAALNGALEIYGDVSEYYTKQAIDNGIVDTLPSTISRFDLWNITTELNSHTEALVDSTGQSLDRIATGLLFPKREIVGVVNDRLESNVFGSPEQAFFGGNLI